jgi:hypothetical protein
MLPKRIDRTAATLFRLGSSRAGFFLVVCLGLSALILGLRAQSDDAAADAFGKSTASESALMGIFYDLKQTQQKDKVPMDSPVYDKTLADFITKGWDETVLDKFYRISKPFYTTQVYVPMTPQNQAARAFGVDDKVTGSYWIVHFKGQVIPPAAGRYRFVGYAHATIFVAVNEKLVLNGCRFSINDTMKDFPLRSVQNPTDPQAGAPAGDWMLTYGQWFDLKADEPVDIDILFGNRVAPVLCAFLMVQKDGETYPTDPNTHFPILPLFQVANYSGPALDMEAKKGTPCTVNKSIWKSLQ